LSAYPTKIGPFVPFPVGQYRQAWIPSASVSCWRALCEQLEEQGVDESITAEIERAVTDLRPPIGRSGIAPTDGVAAVLRYAPTLHPSAP
jgi:hypothetical protein